MNQVLTAPPTDADDPASTPGHAPTTATEVPGLHRVTEVAALVDEAVRFMRTMHSLKGQHANRSAHMLLLPLSSAGPMRLTTLAETVRADPSTASRHVAELVRDDLVRREIDPADGRACRLVVTDSGLEAVAKLRQQGASTLADVLTDWTDEEIASFTHHLRRFTGGVSSRLTGAARPDLAAPNPPHTPHDPHQAQEGS